MKSTLLFLTLLSGCISIQKPSSSFLKKINNKVISQNIINKNGHFYTKDNNPKDLFPLFFFSNNTVYYPFSLGDGGTQQFKFNKEHDYYSPIGYAENNWGVYVVKNDTLNVTMFNVFRTQGQSVIMIEINYQGIIKGSSNILNWHIVPPYPDSVYINNYYFREGLIPRNYQFNVCIDKYKIDSSKAFINKFRAK
ncbi:MAG: hypothetical protein H7331_04540 [Bacteroidia bacterium]|nr:hypothetical protein [Bacteroidia bacterium]